MEFIKASLNFLEVATFLPWQQFTASLSLISTTSDSLQTLVRACLQLLGHMSTMTFIVKYSRLHMRCLQAWLWTVYIPHRHSINKCVMMPNKVKDSNGGGHDQTRFVQESPFHRTLQWWWSLGTSLLGWGAYVQTHTIQGYWSPSEFLLHINLLEL